MWFRDATDEQNHGAAHRKGKAGVACEISPGSSELTETSKAQQQAPELFPGEQPLDGTEPLFEDGRIDRGLRPRLGRFLPREFGLMLGTMPSFFSFPETNRARSAERPVAFLDNRHIREPTFRPRGVPVSGRGLDHSWYPPQ